MEDAEHLYLWAFVADSNDLMLAILALADQLPVPNLDLLIFVDSVSILWYFHSRYLGQAWDSIFSWFAGILNGEVARPQDPAEFC